MKQDIPQIQRYRWENLKLTIQAAQLRIQSESSDKWVQSDLLCALLERLETFAGEAVSWMHNPDNIPKGSPTVKCYVPNNGRYLIAQQAINDFNLIWHIYNQRHGNLNDVHGSIQIIYDLAKDALEPAIKANIVQKDVIIIPYLQKAPSIRIVPYANVAMIGLPYWLSKLRPDAFTFTQTLAQDLLAIPHEVGHFVYWHGLKSGPYKGKHVQAGLARWLKRHILDKYEIPDKDEELFKVLTRWGEEIFADVYGAFAAGEESVQSLMNMLLDYHRPEQFLDIEGAHPAPFFRPYSALAALRVLATRADHEQYNLLPADSGITDQFLQEWKSKMDSSIKQKDIVGSQVHRLFGNTPPTDSKKQAFVSKMSSIMEEMGTYIIENLLDDNGSQNKLVSNTTQRINVVEAKWVREHLNGVNSEKLNTLPFEISWQKWLDTLYEEYEALDLAKYASDPKDRYWVVAMNAGGWTEGPGTGGTSLH